MKRASNRRAIAITTALLWLLAVEVLPNVHLGAHDHHHTHASDGSIVAHADADGELERLHQLAHRQAGTKCLHGKPQRDRHERTSVAGPIDAHAAAGIAHRATAVLDPPLPITTPVAAPHAQTWCFDEPNVAVTSTHTASPVARGPPVRA